MSVNSKMTAIADKIRTLVGASGTMTLDAMATNVGTANNEVTTQADLIAQILEAVEGKAGLKASSVVTGTFTVADESVTHLTLENAFEPQTNAPLMYFIFERGQLNNASHTHEKIWLLCGVSAINDTPQNVKENYYVCVLSSTAGSSSPKATKGIMSNALNWDSNGVNSTLIAVMLGKASEGTLKFGVGGTYGLIAGRTYTWGVMLYDG